MATAQYETRSRTVEETVVVLTVSEDEADELRKLIDDTRWGHGLHNVREALNVPKPPALGTMYADGRGNAYDLMEAYRDTNGDVWSFTGRCDSAGVPRVTMSGNLGNTDTITEIEADWGPLRKVAR
ncbi:MULTISPECIES: phiSA1p31-related protein [unclassified Streptomyces]|uniref:phiSA1p31-related protein n=1 Tax=unclassified Streptomyces TaxID=2593676 RepID=UPI0033E96808